MGYYADGNGYIEFKEALSEELFRKVMEVLGEAFECDRAIGDTQSVCFWNCEKYYADEVETALLAAADLAPIKEGEIEYIGEDRTIWHFIFKDGGWVEENGYAVYKDVHPDKLEHALRAYAEYDLNFCKRSYVFGVLTDVCGLSTDDLRSLGLDYLTPDESAVT